MPTKGKDRTKAPVDHGSALDIVFVLVFVMFVLICLVIEGFYFLQIPFDNLDVDNKEQRPPHAGGCRHRSITASAVARSIGGMSRPSPLAVFAFMINRKYAGC